MDKPSGSTLVDIQRHTMVPPDSCQSACGSRNAPPCIFYRAAIESTKRMHIWPDLALVCWWHTDLCDQLHQVGWFWTINHDENTPALRFVLQLAQAASGWASRVSRLSRQAYDENMTDQKHIVHTHYRRVAGHRHPLRNSETHAHITFHLKYYEMNTM